MANDDGLVKVITVSNCHASIWNNVGGPNGHYFTCSFTRSYEADGETQYTTSFGAYDLGNVFAVGGQALTFMWNESRKLRAPKKKPTSKKSSRRRPFIFHFK